MYLAVGSALLLLLVFGSKIISLWIRVVLLALRKVGLLTNIQVDERMTLTLTIETVHLNVWRNVWKFLGSPTHHPLVTAEIAPIHVMVTIQNEESKTSRVARPPTPSHWQWDGLDTTTSLKRLDHPQWKQVRSWLHRLPFVRFLVPIVGITFSDVKVDIVLSSSTRTQSIVRLQKGCATVRFIYSIKDGEVNMSTRICPDESAVITLIDCGVEAIIRDLSIDMSIPMPHGLQDTRAPVPTSLRVQCDEVGCSIEAVAFAKFIRQERCPSKERTSEESRTQAEINSKKAFHGAVLMSQGMLVIRLVELIPDVTIKVYNIHMSITNCSSTIRSDIDIVECTVRDPSKISAFNRRQGQHPGEAVGERKAVIDVGNLHVYSDIPPTASTLQSSSFTVEVIKVEVESKLSVNSLPTPIATHESLPNDRLLMWCTRCTGEVRGLSVGLADDILPWINFLHSSGPPTKLHDPSDDQGEEVHDNDTGAVWDNFVVIDMQFQLKLLKSDLLCQARRHCCAVLPIGVPNMGLSIDEVAIFVYPFMDGEPLGVRAKADLQASRLKMYCAQSNRLTRTSFISVDFLRVLIEPVSALGSDFTPVEVEMEAEWLEARWMPEAMHAIGGLLDLGITIFSPVIREANDWTSDEYWDPHAPNHVSSMRSMCDVVEDCVSDSEVLKFRCKVKHSLVLFPHKHAGSSHVDYVTVDSLNMSIEETTGRFRLSVFNTKVCTVEGASDLGSLSLNPLLRQQHKAMRHRQSTFPTRSTPQRGQNQSRQNHGKSAQVESMPFFCVKVFGLEENKLHLCPMKVLDLFVDGVACTWDMKTQERIVELIRRVTFSCWEMLYRMRSAYGIQCTSIASRYNREGGINGVITDATECDHAERLLSKLISAGGDTLNRIHATDLDFKGTFGDGQSTFDLRIHVGLFESEDLPELWRFEDVYVALDESLKLIDIGKVLVRHTVNKRRDYVYGFFEETLRLRQIACGRIPSNTPRLDGMMLEIEGLRVGLSLQTDLVQLAGAIYEDISPFIASHVGSFMLPWRPQDDLFYRFFLRIPNTVGQPRVWLQLSNVQVECLDLQMEAWLEHVYPIWMEELAEHELRSQLLQEQVTALKLTNADMLVSDESTNEMMMLLYEKSSKIYAHKIRRLQDNLKSTYQRDSLRNGSFVSVRIDSVAVEIYSEPHEDTVMGFIRELDEATLVSDQVLFSTGLHPNDWKPSYAFLLHQNLNICVTNTYVRMRDFSTPVAVIDELKMGGSAIIAGAKSPDTSTLAFALTAAIRCFADLNISIQRPVLFFAPAYAQTMLEVATIVQRVLPTLLLDVDRVHQSAPWDVARRLLHGQLRVQVENAALQFLAASKTYEIGDYLEAGIHRVDVDCRSGKDAEINATVDRLTVKIEPGALVNNTEITNITLHSKVKWSASSRDVAMHYILPIEFRKRVGNSKGETIVVDLHEGRIWQEDVVILGSRLAEYSATSISVSMSGKIAPKTPMEQMTRRDIASRSAIVLYTKHVEWLIHFGRVYQPLIELKRKRQGIRCHINVIVNRFLNIFRGVVVEDFGFIGLDVALYHSERSPIGLRACVNDKIAFSGAVNATKASKSFTNSSRQSTPRQVSIDWNGYSFVLNSVSLSVSDVQVRICTPSTGSRGESLVSIRDVCLNVGGGGKASSQTHESFDFAQLHSELFNNPVVATSMSEGDSSDLRLSSFKSLSPAPSISPETTDGVNELSRPKSKISILEHFAIPQHNPYHYRDDNSAKSSSCDEEISHETVEDDQVRANRRRIIQETFVEDFRTQGFLLGLSASEIRVLVTLDTVETLVDVVENWVLVLRASLPELYRVPDEILNPPSVSDPNTANAAGIGSPKKASSLADDPRFGPIFHASNPIPSSRTPSFSLDIPHDDTGMFGVTQMSPASSAGVVKPFLTVRFMDCQINFQDHANKGSVLLALSRGTLRHSRSQNVHHEMIDLRVDGLQLFTSPLDIDVRSRVIWLRTIDDGFTYSLNSYGLLKQVVAPIPAKAMIWIDRNITVVNRVDLDIPSVQIEVNIDSKNIMEKLGISLASVITTKLAEYQAPDYSRMLQGFSGSQNQVNIQSSLQQLLLERKQLKWKITEMHWQHACRWDYRVAERANLAMQAVEGARNHSYLDFDFISSSILQARRPSSASLISSTGTSLTLSGSTTTQVETASDELQRLQQQYDSIGEVLRSLVAAEMLKRQPNPNIELTFALHSSSLTMSSTNSDIFSAAMTDLIVKLKTYEDQSGTVTLTIQDVCCKNLCPNTPYPELLIPLKNSKSWSGDEMFVRIDAEVAPPVGGIKVVRHFEINVHPMQVCLSYDFILQLVAFFTSDSGSSPPQDAKKAQVRAHFLAAPQFAGTSHGEGFLRKAVKVAGKAAHPLTHGLGRQRANSDQDQRMDPRVKAVQALQEEATQWISRVARSESTFSITGDQEAPPLSGTEKDLHEMRDRASNNILFKRIRLGTVEVMVSFKNKKSSSSGTTGQQALEDMRGFEVKIHSLVYSDKTCSLMDLLLRIRRDVILDVLSQVGRNFTNVANFLRDQLDITRWGTFDALAPLKSLSTAIAGSSQTSLPSVPATINVSSSPGCLSMEMLQRSPHNFQDTRPATPPDPVDTSKVFQLELPESHPSRRKKWAPQLRPTEPVPKAIDAVVQPLPSSKVDQEDINAQSTGIFAKKKISKFFGKSKRNLQTPASIAEDEETAD